MFRACVLTSVLLAAGCSSSVPTVPETKDLATYVANLKRAIPLNVSEFTKKGLKAEEYKKDPEPEADMFLWLIIKVDPVTLEDKVTGKSAKYTRAKLVRNTPAPYRPGAFPEVYEWQTIDMLP